MADNTDKPQDDLSIEEILGSIRRIIAEDEDDAAPPKKAEATEDDFDEEEEPLELTRKVEEERGIAHTPIDELSLDAPTDIIDIGLEEDIDEMVADEPPAPVAQPPKMTARDEEPKPMSTENSVQDNLLSPSASIATAAVMAKLARQAAVNEDGNGALTIESMVREMLRPLLKDWLDANLPDLVQKMVERELDRLTKRL